MSRGNINNRLQQAGAGYTKEWETGYQPHPVHCEAGRMRSTAIISNPLEDQTIGGATHAARRETPAPPPKNEKKKPEERLPRKAPNS
jgi:hypothetical protein